jgi:hypothetical protein
MLDKKLCSPTNSDSETCAGNYTDHDFHANRIPSISPIEWITAVLPIGQTLSSFDPFETNGCHTSILTGCEPPYYSVSSNKKHLEERSQEIGSRLSKVNPSIYLFPFMMSVLLIWNPKDLNCLIWLYLATIWAIYFFLLFTTVFLSSEREKADAPTNNNKVKKPNKLGRDTPSRAFHSHECRSNCDRIGSASAVPG